MTANKALVFVAGDLSVSRYLLTASGIEREPDGQSDKAFRLAAWFRNGWQLDYGLPTGANGATLLILRDGKPLDAWDMKG